jgi:hypothetical protein
MDMVDLIFLVLGIWCLTFSAALGAIVFYFHFHDKTIKRLLEELAEAEKNDNRDPETGRYVGAK